MWLSIVIPAYNEEKIIARNLKIVSEYLSDFGQSFEILISDDGSSDNTVSKVETISKDIPQVKLIKNEHKGKAHAVYRGVMEAQGDLVHLTDADLSTPIEEIDKMLPFIKQGYDIVVASREGLNANRVDEPFYRHLMGRVFNYLVQILVIRGIQDTQCGFKLLTKKSAKKIFSHMKLYGEDSKVLLEPAVTAYDVEMLFLARRYGYKIKEVPVVWIYRQETRVNAFRDSYRNFRDVLKVRLNDIKGLYK